MKRKNNLTVDKEVLEKLYKEHSVSEICKILDIGRSRIEVLFSLYEIEKKPQSLIQRNKSVREKTNNTLKEKYGDNWGFNSTKYKEAINIKYGGNPMRCDDIKLKQKQTCVEKYGGYTFQSDILKEKVKKTNIEKYGVENVSNNSDIINKIKQVKFEKYGSENYNNIEKHKITILNKYEVDNVSKIAWVKDKKQQTMIENYGVEYNFKRLEVQRKSLRNLFKVKEYMFQSGRKTLILGYEGIMLDLLLSSGVNEDDILTNDECPNVEWFDTEGKKHNHIPDIYIKSENKIIEVKGDYTASEKFIEIIRLKKKFAEEQGFEYKVYVVSGKTKTIKYEIS